MAPGYNPFGADFLKKPDGTAYYIPVVPYMTAAAWPYVATHVCETYIERAGGQTAIFDPNFELETEIQMLEDLKTGNPTPDGILMGAVDTAGCAPIVDELNDAGIPIIAWDFNITSDKLVSWSNHSQYDRAYILGKWVVDYVNKTGQTLNFYEMWCPKVWEGSWDRDKGFRDAVAGNPLINIAIEGPDRCPFAEEVSNAIMDTFPAHPELNAYYGQGGPGCAAGFEGLGQLYPVGDPRHIVIIHGDGDEEILDAVRDGYFDCCIPHSPWEEADAAVKAMFTYVVLGQSVPRNIVVETCDLVTQDTLYNPRWGAPALWGYMDDSRFSDWPVLEPPPESIGGIVTPTMELRKQMVGY